jgi:uncharacterized cupin superfamily protein
LLPAIVLQGLVAMAAETPSFRCFSDRFQDAPRPRVDHSLACGEQVAAPHPTENFMTLTAHAAIAHLHVPSAALASWPLPGELIVEGSPQASGAVLSKSADSKKVRGIWSCTPGTFRWNWNYDETVFMLAGRATVELADGRVVELKAGDMAFFEIGEESVWTIHETLRKGFHADAPEPLPF